MEIKDYSKRLNDHRENFNRVIDEQRDNYEKNVDNLKETQDYRLDKQRKSYDKSVRNLEVDQANFRETSTADTRKSIEKQQKQFMSKLDTNKREFDRDRSELKDEFNTRFEGIKRSYEAKGNSDKAFMDHKVATSQDKFNNTLEKMNDHFNSTIDNVYADARDKAHAHELSTKNDQRNLVNKYEDELRSTVKDGSVKRAKIYDRFAEDVNNLRNTHADRESTLKEYQNERIQDMVEKKNEQLAAGQKNFEKSINRITDQNMRKRQIEQRDSKQVSLDSENRHAKELYRARREMNAKLSGGSREDIYNDKLDKVKNSYNTRIKNIYAEIENDRFNADVQSKKNNQANKDNMRIQKQTASNNIEKLEKDMAQFKNKTLKTMSYRQGQEVQDIQNDYRSQLMQQELSANNDQDQAKMILEKQKVQFGETIESINAKNSEAVSEMQEDFAQETKKYVQDTRLAHSKEMLEAKEQFLDTKEKITKSLNEKIEHLETENDKLMTAYEGKLARLKKANAKEIDRIRSNYEIQADQLKTQTRNVIALKDKENKLNTVQQRGEFDKQLSQVKQSADMQVKRMVEYYETKLERESDESQRKYVSKVNELENQYNSLYENSKIERANLVNQYENRMEEMRAANAEAVEEKAQEQRIGMFAKQQESRNA